MPVLVAPTATASAAIAAVVPAKKGVHGPTKVARKDAIGAPAEAPPRRTTANRDMTRPSMRASADCSMAIVVPRKYDQPIPTAARPASAAGRSGATAVAASPHAMIVAATGNASGPGMPRAARASAPVRLPELGFLQDRLPARTAAGWVRLGGPYRNVTGYRAEDGAGHHATSA